MESAVVESSRTKKPPLLSGVVLLFLFAMILANLGGNMYGPLMSLYVRDLGASVEQIGLFFTLSSIIPLALQILGGYISDVLGRLRAIAIGSVVGIFTYVALLLAPTWQWLLLAMAFAAVTGSLVGPSFDAFIAENSSEENRARTFGVSQALFGIVGVAGPLAGGFLANNYGFKSMLLVAGFLYILATIIRVGMARVAARNSKEAHPAKLSFSSLKDNLGTMFGLLAAGGVVTWILITDGVRDISFALSMNFLTVYMQDFAHLNLTQIGLTNSVFGLMAMMSTIPGGWLADKAGERVGIALGFLLVAASLAMLIFLPVGPLWQYAAGWGVAGTGVGVLQPAYMSLISKAVPQKVRGTAFGLFSASVGLVSLPAPMIGGWLWQTVNPQFPFVVTIVVCVLSVIPVWFKFKIPKPTETSEQIEESAS
ncbi:MAG: MFS transporter [Anaerolineaceae bacterium]|jgi:MFS family permease|nr:MFS transporter [Anaerolineae bacterium]MBV6464908.1 Multidrug resistance protein MdtG [Anaerolineales bacterium]MDL1925446.1 MFS transporter [Anaerolineae bacterium AMX1]GER79373.1 major facilitator superfamily (MSF) transporter [Candidatus Denitrolinea symbiosum]GIK09951.1 MAG: MFS transporter [Chloroflexota bacterium]GJQ38946.1 MAG: MFS transporter [Anaerolineaceae bacterium]